MIVITRYRVPSEDREAFLSEAAGAVRALSSRSGCRAVRVARAVDDGGLWVMQSEWDSVGAYRRALSAPEVKLLAVPLMYRCVDEPSAFEIRLDAVDGEVTEVAGALAEDG